MKNVLRTCDRKWSVAWICSFINFMYLGVPRLSGLLYLAAISRYNTNRYQASLPFLLCYTVRNISGPVIGYLSRKVEVETLIVLGCLISSIGVGACFFAESITTVSILYGGVFGLGFGLSTILIPCVLNQHFGKYINIANGVSLGGECIAGFVLPPLFEFFHSTYGTSGSFLILSGLILHGVPAALLLKPPEKKPLVEVDASKPESEHGFHTSETENKGICNDIFYFSSYLEKEASSRADYSNYRASCSENDNVNARHFENEEQAINKHCRSLHLDKHRDPKIPPKSSIISENTDGDDSLKYVPVYAQLTTNASTIPSQDLERYNCFHHSHDTNSFYHLRTKRRNSAADPVLRIEPTSSSETKNTNASAIPSQDRERYNCFHHSHDTNRFCHLRTERRNSAADRVLPIEPTSSSETKNTNASAIPSQDRERYNCFHHSHDTNSFCYLRTERRNSAADPVLPIEPTSSSETKSTESSSLRVFLDPTFILILFTQSSIIFIATTFSTIIVDFSKDAGVTDDQAVYVLMCFSISDMLGRFCLGWITDMGYMSSVVFSSLEYGIMGASVVALVWLREFPLVMAAVFFYGLLLGGLIIIGPGITSEFIEPDKVNIALASRFCLFAPMSLTQSSMIGYFRDTLGSYKGIFYLLGLNSLFCSVLSLLIPPTARCRERRKVENLDVG